MRIINLLTALTILVSMNVNGQSRPISGKVTDQAGAPIPNASVRIKGSQAGTSADMNGNFRVLANPNATLVVSAVDFEDQQINIGDRQDVNVVMTRVTRALSEVVVTALGIRRQAKELGYA